MLKVRLKIKEQEEIIKKDKEGGDVKDENETHRTRRENKEGGDVKGETETYRKKTEDTGGDVECEIETHATRRGNKERYRREMSKIRLDPNNIKGTNIN